MFDSVTAVMNNYQSAVNAKDVERFISVYAEDAHVFDCWGKWEYMDRDGLKAMATDWFRSLTEENIRVKVSFRSVAVEQNGTIAYAHGAAVFSVYAMSGSKQMLSQKINRYTVCLKNDGRGWLITHEHSSLPIDMVTGKGLPDTGGD